MKSETRGAFDSITVDGGLLAIDGWAFAFDAGPPTRLSVHAGERKVEDCDVTTGHASPDLEKAYPGVPNVGQARFRIRRRIEPAVASRLSQSLIRIAPWFGERPGYSLFGLPKAAIPLPAKEDVDVIGGELQNGFEFLGVFIERAGLRAAQDVLDVGCGVGRMALPLAFYLSSTARYNGFDVSPNGVEWASRVISSRFPNFQFVTVDVRNDAYNPSGRLRATDFAFPYDDRSFDFAFLTSVFTHMRAPEVRHYLEEIHRVLRLGGRCVCTCFLLNEESHGLIASGRSSLRLTHDVGEGFASSRWTPEKAIGFEESLVLRWIAERGLAVRSKFYGAWCGRSPFTSYQDILILGKD